MKTIPGLAFSLLLLLLCGCGSMTFVHDLTANPNGSRVDVVGAEYYQDFYGRLAIVTPKRWTCLRDAQGRLACQRDTTVLPMPE